MFKRIIILVVLMLSIQHTAAALPLPVITVTSPIAYQVYQRDITTNTASIHIMGYITNWIGGMLSLDWNKQVVTLSPDENGDFDFVWENRPVGQGFLTVRILGTHIYKQVLVSVGDVYIFAGQSNANGEGYHLQKYTAYFNLRASRYGRDFKWGQLIDPVGGDAGSYWPLLATYILHDHIPVAFVPTSAAHSSILDWQPGGVLYTNLSMHVIPARAVLWDQGETDSHNGMDARTYADNLEKLSGALWNDFKLPLFAVRLQHMSYATGSQLQAINDGIDIAVNEGEHIYAGADFSALHADDSAHLRSDLNLKAAALLWWDALLANGFYP